LDFRPCADGVIGAVGFLLANSGRQGRVAKMKTPMKFMLLMLAMSGSTLCAAEIKWPKGSFTVEKLADAVKLAGEEKKPVAYLIMFRGEKPDRRERRERGEDAQDPSAAYDLTEDFAKDCAKFAVVVHVDPGQLGMDPSPFPEKVLEAMAAAIAPGTVPAVVIADAEGGLIFARGTSTEMQEDGRKIVRDAKENHKLGKAMEYRAPEGGGERKSKE
jgi:hypothetical protein